MEAVKWINVALRGVMELGIVVALGWWGYGMGSSAATRWLFAIGAPAIGFGVWGLIDFRGAGAMAEWLRLGQELVISFGAAWAWLAAGRPYLGGALGALSIVHHALVYLTGERLLKP